MPTERRSRGRLTARPLLLVAVGLGALAVADGAWADAPSAQFRAYLRSQYGVVNPRYARCPRVARFDGTALCEAQFRPRRRWRFVSVTLRDGQVLFPFTRTWTRRWRTCSRRSRYVPGPASVEHGLLRLSDGRRHPGLGPVAWPISAKGGATRHQQARLRAAGVVQVHPQAAHRPLHELAGRLVQVHGAALSRTSDRRLTAAGGRAVSTRRASVSAADAGKDVIG
jgi:hypothetical protein